MFCPCRQRYEHKSGSHLVAIPSFRAYLQPLDRRPEVEWRVQDRAAGHCGLDAVPGIDYTPGERYLAATQTTAGTRLCTPPSTPPAPDASDRVDAATHHAHRMLAGSVTT